MTLLPRGFWGRGAGGALTLLALVGCEPVIPDPNPDPPPITIESSTVTPSTIIGGSGGTQTITLSEAAPEGGTMVRVYYDNIYRESTTGMVVVPAGETSVTFPFRAGAPDVTRTATISAQVDGSRLRPITTFTHEAADPATRAVSELRFDRPAALHATTVTGTVVLKSPAPAGGLTVSLWSNSSYGGTSLRVPLFVTVPEGQISATFPAIAIAASPGLVRPSADLGTSLVTTDFIAVPATFDLGARTDSRNGGSLVVGIGDAPNPTGTVVNLRSSNRDIVLPAQVTVPAGQPGVAIPVENEFGHASFDVIATWNGQSVTRTIYFPPA